MFHMLTWSMDCVAMLIVYNIAETCRVHGKLILALAMCFTRSLKTKMPQFMNVLKRADVPKRFTPTWFIKIRWHHVSHETHLILISSLGCTPSTYMSSSHWCLNFMLRHLLHSVSDLFLFFSHAKPSTGFTHVRCVHTLFDDWGCVTRVGRALALGRPKVTKGEMLDHLVLRNLLITWSGTSQIMTEICRIQDRFAAGFLK